MLEKAKAEGVVLEVKTLYDEYFKNEGKDSFVAPAIDPMCLPYFEGDYVPGEIENIIKDVNLEEETKKKEAATKGVSAGPRPRKVGKKIGTRSNPGELVNQTRDKVMLRLGQAMSNMKQNFMVVYLRSRKFAAAVESGEDVSEWVEKDEEEEVRKMINGKDSTILFSGAEVENETKKKEIGPSSLKVGASKSNSICHVDDASAAESLGAASITPPPIMEAEEEKETNRGSDCANQLTVVTGGKSTKRIGSTEDEDPPQESECFDSRQQFLNYCQANHFQFDELRRTKHSTMMVLFHLHNPNVPKFLQQCGACYREITHGFRYHCNSCSNFDLCQDCYEPVTTGLWAQRDSRFAHDKKHSFTSIDMEATIDTQKSREERARAIKVHLELLSHAANCPGAPGCTLNNCNRMKKLFEHVKTCNVTYKKGCKVCARLLALLSMHARLCTVRDICAIPFCDRIRERNRRLRQQQQLMDDRRRQAQNELYRGSGRSITGNGDDS